MSGSMSHEFANFLSPIELLIQYLAKLKENLFCLWFRNDDTIYLFITKSL
jgi:hypothetical protein